jgi:hypothetical protein
MKNYINLIFIFEFGQTMKSILYALFFYLIFIGCAQKVPPVGGKKDIISPKIISTIPKNQTLNFNGKEIEIYFDEYVKTENINQNLIITPAIEGTYTSKPKATGVRLIFDKPFKPNTTYNFNFRSTFKDITESNEAKNIRIVFSTGQQIDSLKTSGTVTDPLTNKPVFDAMVGLYKLTDTLNIKKEKPYYFTKTDSTGYFNIENIQANKYKIYAFSDINNNTIFNEVTEKIGYISDTLLLNKNIANIKLNLVKQDKLPLKIVKNRTSQSAAYIELNKGIREFKLKFQNLNDSIPYILLAEKEIKLFNIKNITDTLKFDLVSIDSVGNESIIKQKILFKKPTKKVEGIKDEFKFNIEPQSNKAIENNASFKITFTKPIAKFDPEKVNILNDTLKNIDLKPEHFSWNKHKNILTITPKTKASNTLRLKILENAFFSVENDTLKKYVQDYKIIQVDDTGIISGEIKSFNGTEIVQLLNEKNEVEKEMKYLKIYTFKNVLPGKYFLRLIQDSNKNGEWDAGNVEKNILPEKILYINNIIQVKANFELTGFNF